MVVSQSSELPHSQHRTGHAAFDRARLGLDVRLVDRTGPSRWL